MNNVFLFLNFSEASQDNIFIYKGVFNPSSMFLYLSVYNASNMSAMC